MATSKSSTAAVLRRCYESCHDGLIALSLVNDRPYVKRMTERGAEASKIDTQ